MRNLWFASVVSLLAIAWAGVAQAASSTDRERDWDWCNGTVDGGVPNDVQIAGCSARIDSGEESDTNLFVAHYNRGFAYYNKGDYDQAIADYALAIALKPGEATAFTGRGLAYFHTGQYESAASDFGQAIRLRPANADAYYQRATAYAAHSPEGPKLNSW